ncbi:thiamine phosphate synthase [Pantoea sp. Mhis]|uniref:thiamine phosphate synthase n=1 Tax=Pantoea sp. Mhis TaxID=2576759 RepID=UPI00135A55FF|nr:thiamine phosphate synthase [Pantoea sp. Mhis]MXP56519.1 thiamine phosphate synthase [Pantoea sp. Mhis]
MINHFPPTDAQLGLYPIVDNVTWIARLLDIGVRTIQLRIKNVKCISIEDNIHQAIILTKQYNARLFINDYWRLAIKYNAYGVHLGQEDLKYADLKAISQAGLRLGLSTHNDNELNYALMFHPSYIALGHIFPTKTKKMASSPQGLDMLRKQSAHLKSKGIPSVAIGGISLQRAPEVLLTGVGSIAVISAITESIDWYTVTQKFLNLFENKQKYI